MDAWSVIRFSLRASQREHVQVHRKVHGREAALDRAAGQVSPRTCCARVPVWREGEVTSDAPGWSEGELFQLAPVERAPPACERTANPTLLRERLVVAP